MTNWSRGPFWATISVTVLASIIITIFAWVVGLDRANLVLPVILTVLTAGILGATVLLVMKRESVKSESESTAAPASFIIQVTDNNSQNINAAGSVTINNSDPNGRRDVER